MRVRATIKKTPKKEQQYNPTPLEWCINTTSWTKEQKDLERSKCKNDPKYFLKRYGCVQHPIRGKVRFDTYPFQDQIIDDLFHNKNIAVLKSRQLGVSTLIAAFAAWLSIFYPDKVTLVIATKQTVAKGFLDKFKLIYQYCPKWMKPEVKEWNKLSVSFSNGSFIQVSTTTEDAGASYALSLLVVDEAALLGKRMDAIWTSAAPTISTGGKAVVISTPRGPQGWFFKTCSAAEEAQRLKEEGFQLTPEQEKTNFHLIKLPWEVHPERDQAWFDNMCKTFNYDERKIAQELLCSFTRSGDKVIKPEVIEALRKDKRRVPVLPDMEKKIFNLVSTYLPFVLSQYNIKDKAQRETIAIALTRELKDNLTLYREPRGEEEIFFGADVASGGAEDFSAFLGTDKTGFNVCAYKGKVDTKMFAIILFMLGSYYNDASLAIERNTYGKDVLLRLSSELHYNNVLDGLDGKAGFNTSAGSQGGTRAFYVSRLIGLLQTPSSEQNPVINDLRIITELDSFVWLNDKPQASAGAHDDITMAFCILATVITTLDEENPIGVLSNSILETVNRLGKQKDQRIQDTVTAILSEDEENLLKVLDSGNNDQDIFELMEDTYMSFDDNEELRSQEEVWDFFGIEHSDRAQIKRRKDSGIIVHFDK